MYILNNACVKYGKKLSDDFHILNGVKQGSILGSILFSIYLDPLLQLIKNSGVGCYVGAMPVNILAYADDLLLLAPTLFGLKKLISLCEDYGSEYGVSFNPDKSFMMIFSNSLVFDDKNVNIIMNGKTIKICDRGKHLGLNIGSREVDNFYVLDDTIRDMKVKTNAICSNFNSLNSMSRAHIFRSQCYSLYGCQLWNLESRGVSSMEICWRKCCRSILGLAPRTHNVLIPHLIESNPIRNIIERRIISFILNGIKHPNELIRFFFNSALVGNYSSTLKTLNVILCRNNVNYMQLFSGKKLNLTIDLDIENQWKVGIIKELIHMRDHKLYDVLSKNEMVFLICNLCTE